MSYPLSLYTIQSNPYILLIDDSVTRLAQQMIIPEGKEVGWATKVAFTVVQVGLVVTICFIQPQSIQTYHLPALRLFFYNSIFLLAGNAFSSITDQKLEWSSLILALVLQAYGQLFYLAVTFYLGIYPEMSLNQLNNSSGLGVCSFFIMSPLLSKVSALVLLIVMLVVTPIYCVIQWQVVDIYQVFDNAGIFRDHLYGCTVALVLSSFLNTYIARKSFNRLLANFQQNILSIIGSILNMIYLPFILAGIGNNSSIILVNIMLCQLGSTLSSFITAYAINGELTAQDMMVISFVGSISITLYSHLLLIPMLALITGAISGMVFVVCSNSSFIKSALLDGQQFVYTLEEEEDEKNEQSRGYISFRYYDPGMNLVSQMIPSLSAVLAALLLLSTFHPDIPGGYRDYSLKIFLFTITCISLGLASGLFIIFILKVLYYIHPSLLDQYNPQPQSDQYNKKAGTFLMQIIDENKELFMKKDTLQEIKKMIDLQLVERECRVEDSMSVEDQEQRMKDITALVHLMK